MTNLSAAAVALVVLVDLVTGQGPPIYTNYLQAQSDFRPPPPPPPPPMHPVAYVHRSEFDGKKLDKEFEKAIELGKKDTEKGYKKGDEYGKGPYGREGGKDKAGDGYDKKEGYSTPAPGVLSSLSNSMSGAWSRISSLGRSKRESNGAAANEKVNNSSASPQGTGETSSKGRTIDSCK